MSVGQRHNTHQTNTTSPHDLQQEEQSHVPDILMTLLDGRYDHVPEFPHHYDARVQTLIPKAAIQNWRLQVHGYDGHRSAQLEYFDWGSTLPVELG